MIKEIEEVIVKNITNSYEMNLNKKYSKIVVGK